MTTYKFNITVYAPSGSRTTDVRDYILKVMSNGRLKVGGVKFVPKEEINGTRKIDRNKLEEKRIE